MNDFFKAIQIYLLQYLPEQKCYSENTVRSYKQVLNLFVSYLRNIEGIGIKKITFRTVTRDVILNFLNWLEKERGCGSSTRNHRLMVLRSFFNYAGSLDCTNIFVSMEASRVPVKKTMETAVPYLSENALETFLKQPNIIKPKELRDLFFMVLMYDTAARCNELLTMKIRDLRIGTEHPIAYLHGKGNKTRMVPLLSRTVKHCERYLSEFHPGEVADSEKPLFFTKIHRIQQPISHDAVQYFFNKYTEKARSTSSEIPERITPHMLRHTRAMHLYQQGMPLALLSDFLGHSSVETTRIYAYADTEMKRAAIEKADVIQRGDSLPTPIWIDDEGMILKLSGLI
jgi:site-specific recombinase XerD